MSNHLLTLLAGLALLFILLLLFWPDSGLVSRWNQMRRVSNRVLLEDALKHLHKSAVKGLRPNLQSVAGDLQINVNRAAELVDSMEKQGLLALSNGDLRLTPAGRDYALHVIRAHRLWERYLADETGYDEVEWHGQADYYEHMLTKDRADALSAKLGNPAYDPHGDPIPTAAGEMKPHGGQPLTALGVDQPARIVHIEDEPEAVYAQILAEGLYPGMEVRVIETAPQRIRFWANSDEHLLAPLVAANISVLPSPLEETALPAGAEPLSALKPGQAGRVINISPRCRGPERRRMLDLGILPGTLVQAEMNSPSGDPTAYRVRGALIALRDEQAVYINVQRFEEGTS
jgi:DtxR family Mn-dependent transcriptional regulator